MKRLSLSDLSIEQKIGQMLLCRKPLDDEDKKGILELIANRCLGGIHLVYLTKEEISEYLNVADYPLLVCDNMESGFVNGKIDLPCPLAISATDNEEYAYEFARITAIQAKACGYNLVFGPVLDISMNPAASCGGTRTFGGYTDLVSRMAAAAIRGYQSQGMVVAAKHYPGFGESEVDSHIGMVYLKGDKKLLLERELEPYRYAIENAELSGVMVGHISVPKLDDKYPASISPMLVKLLRGIGYDGLIMTDSMAMLGITNFFGLEECHTLAMAAGIDMVMTSYRIRAKTAFEYMLNAYKKGRVTEEQINSAAARVIKAQARTLEKAEIKDVDDACRATARNISRDSITAILRNVDSASVPTDLRHLFIIETGVTITDPDTGEIELEKSNLNRIEDLIKEKFPKSVITRISKFPGRLQMERVVTETMNYESVIIVAYNRVSGYTGSADETRRLLALMDGIAHKLSAILIFGNPYPAREYPPVPRLIIGYENGNCEEEAIKVLAGERTATGKLPIPLKLKNSM